MMSVWLRWNCNRRNERRKVKVRIKVQTDKIRGMFDPLAGKKMLRLPTTAPVTP